MMDDKKTFAPGAGEDYEAILREKQRRVSMLYDGVMGQLPEWMPRRVRLEFTATRTRILKTHTHADLLEAISNVIDAHGERFGDEDYLKFEFNSKGFSFDIAVLARMKKAVELGPVDGLGLMTDQEHAKRATEGEKFLNNHRKLGTVGPIRKAITGAFKKNPTIKNPDIWKLLAANSPRGFTFHDNPQGKYIEIYKTGRLVMKIGRFYNLCGEERKKLEE